jgi:RND family efflux transporter MFP subunit
VGVRVFEVTPSVNRDDLTIPAALSIEGVAVVAAQRDGAIAQLGAQEGSHVAKGQLVARLSGSDDLRAELRGAELEVNRLKVEQAQLEALIRLDRSELDREKTLAKDGLSSQHDVERAQFKFDAATLELEKSRVAGQVAQSKVEGLNAELKKTTINAPIAGIITHRYVELGSSVARNDKLFEISPTSSLQVKFQLSQTETGRLRPGSVVGISLAQGGSVVASARVRRIQPVADAASNTVGYVADVIAGRDLLAGMAVNVHIPRSVASANLLVPKSAFPADSELRRGTAATLFVIQDNKAQPRSVWVNSIDGDQAEIVSGLSAGDRIVLSPPVSLRAGDTVSVSN